MTELFGLPISPWTEKARFALDHHGVAYRYRIYVPMLGEPLLRARLRRPVGRVTVPVLFTDEGAFADSFAIARYADRVGAGAPLVPSERAADVAAWNDRSEAALAAGRALTLGRLAASPAARDEAMPRFVPKGARGALGGLASAGIAYVGAKYGVAGAGEGALAATRATLVALREALGGRPYLYDALTYADVTMAAVLQMVRPAADAFVPLGPGTREAFAIEELAREFGDLVAWRDALYAKHRAKRRRTS